MNQVEFENTVDRFETRWSDSSRTEIIDFLDKHRDSPDLLLELIHADLELRLKFGESARVESYLQSSPELAPDFDSMAGLIRTEHGVRERREPELRLSEYVLRFPEHYQCLLDSENEFDGASEFSARPKVFPQTNASTRSYATSRFSMENMHAEGGLGNVWLAHDHELDRKVALKEIRHKHASDPTHQSRFIQEAMITGFLDHPGVVPVHSLGYFRDGRPYYAMRLIKGRSLREQIHQFHDSLTTKGRVPKHDLAFRRLVQHFLDACNTIDYAHSRGVIHRDLKPGNIMIGEYGETLVVDWGLAKLIDHDQSSGDSHGGEFANETISGFHQIETTVAGQVIGSPAFMSPEQASGSIDRVGGASDIYSLGATLYMLVTNQVRQPQMLEESESSRGLEKSNCKVSRDLVPLISVCRKAMAFHAGDRFSSVKQLAENVESFLADASVSAHQESLTERLARLARRNQTFVRVTAVAASLVAVVSTVAAIWINTERQKASDSAALAMALTESERDAKTSALRSRNSAQEVQEFLSDLFILYGPTNRGQVPDIEENLASFRKLIEESEPITRARGYDVLAQFHQMKGEQQAAIDLFEKALGLIEENYTADSGEYISALAKLAFACYESNYESRGIVLARQVQGLAANSGDVDDATKLTILSLNADIACDHENHAEAIDWAKDARKLADRIFKQDPRHKQRTVQWLIVMNRLAGVYMRTGEHSSLTNAKTLFDRIIQVQNDHQLASTRAGLTTLSNLANWYRVTGNDELAVSTFRQVASQRAEFLGENDIETLKAESLLGNALYHQAARTKNLGRSKYDASARVLEKALTNQIQHLGLGNPGTAKTAIFLATAWRKGYQKQPDGFEENERRTGLLQRVVGRHQALRGKSDFMVLRLKNQVALYVQKTGDRDQAGQLFLEINSGLIERRKTLGLTRYHSKEKAMMSNCSAHFIEAHECQRAYEILIDLVADDDNTIGQSTPGRIFMLGHCCTQMNQLEKATEYLSASCESFALDNRSRAMSDLEFRANIEYLLVLQRQKRVAELRSHRDLLLTDYRSRLSPEQVDVVAGVSEQPGQEKPGKDGADQ